MAYLLGFIAADGCLVKNKRGACFLEIKSIDREIIYKVRSILGSDHKINSKQPSNKNWHRVYRLQIGSKRGI